MPAVKVRREDGSTATVEVEDLRHYEVEIEGDGDEWYMRYEIARGDTPEEAGRACSLEDCERIAGSRLLSPAEVAVLVLNGMTIAGEDGEGDLTPPRGQS
jgi:hypothetical protein